MRTPCPPNRKLQVYAVLYALCILALTVAVIWIAIVEPVTLLFSVFVVPWGWFFALCELGVVFDPELRNRYGGKGRTRYR